MKTKMDKATKANFLVNDDEHVQNITHFDAPIDGIGATAQLVAENYLGQFSGDLGLQDNSLDNMSLEMSNTLNDSKPELRFVDEKVMFDNSTVTYQQTVLGLPVWGAGVTIQIKQDPYRVLNSSSTVYEKIDVKKPSAAALKKYKKVTASELKAAIGSKKAINGIKINSSELYVYQYKAANRLLEHNHSEEGDTFCQHVEHFTLAKVPAAIKEDSFSVVSCVHFTANDGHSDVPYIALIDIEKNSVLYLRSMSSELTGLVFAADPFTLTGNLALTPASTDAALNPLRSTVTLQGLVPPVLGFQQLIGNYVKIQEIETPTVASPVVVGAGNFNYNARTNNFSAVNAYYHNDRFFRFVTGLGFGASYWGSTVFPLPVDHRGLGNVLNAHCVGNGGNGIGHACYALADTTNTAAPLGIAADWRVVLHELGGHGVLYCHVNSPNFGFAHSAGDSFAAIVNDPESQAPDRFGTFPWLLPSRRHDRSVASGWAWGGSNDVGGYNSEQILCTTLFRLYRSIGGDSTSVNMRKFASNFASYLILRAIGNLTPTHATQTGVGLAKVTAFCNELISANLGDWTSTGHIGGAYGKVIRWAFEKQGLFQAAGAPTPVTTVGKPPAVDVYINDGRNGEYTYQPVHWNNTNVWNRRANDGGTTHQEPVVGVTNYAYAKIKNRGTSIATGVVVRGYHANPSAGLNFPADWTPMTTAALAAPNVAANNAAEIIVGPFAWTPAHLGHECMLMIVSAAGDASNTIHIGAGENMPEWRLVPNDNNCGQRNVAPVAAAGGLRGLLASFEGRQYIIRNPLMETAKIQIEIQLPRMLQKMKVNLEVAEAREGFLKLERGGKIAATFKMDVPENFELNEKDFEKDNLIHVITKANGITIGGMSYYLDFKQKEPTGRGGGGKNPFPIKPVKPILPIKPNLKKKKATKKAAKK